MSTIKLSADPKKPILQSAKTKATFTPSSTLWSDPNVLWSDPNALWGGYDPAQDRAPVLFSTAQKPSLMNIGFESESGGTITLLRGMPMGLLLTLTYPEEQIIVT